MRWRARAFYGGSLDGQVSDAIGVDCTGIPEIVAFCYAQPGRGFCVLTRSMEVYEDCGCNAVTAYVYRLIKDEDKATELLLTLDWRPVR